MSDGVMHYPAGEAVDLVPDSIKVTHLRDGPITAAVYQFAPGTKVGPDHHTRTEIGYVVSGTLYDEYNTYEQGDLLVGAAGTTHHPATDTGATVLIIQLD